MEHIVRHTEMGPGDTHEMPAWMALGTCPICGVMVLRWSRIEGPDKQAYINAIRFMMDEGRARYLRNRMKVASGAPTT